MPSEDDTGDGAETGDGPETGDGADGPDAGDGVDGADGPETGDGAETGDTADDPGSPSPSDPASGPSGSVDAAIQPPGLPNAVDTTTVAGVPVPTPCRDRLDEAALRDAVAAATEHDVAALWVSPSGGLKCRVGVRRPARVRQSLRAALAEAGYGVTDHGVRRGFRRLRVGLVPP